MNVKLIKTQFPYCIHRIEDGRYVILNRNYKPLGMTREDSVDWVDYAPHAIELRLTPKRIEQLDAQGNGSESRVYLYYSIHTVTQADEWAAYCKRLKVLALMTTSTKNTPENPPESDEWRQRRLSREGDG
ncbi:MAG: hypothetical protein AAFQ89_17510 [Cyanobacteria bacterium J06626_18]